MAKPTGEPSWRYRRIAIYVVVVWACSQLYRLVDAGDTRLNETIAWGWQVLIIVLVLGYTGFATVQDIIAIWRVRSGNPYAAPAVPDAPTAVKPDDTDETGEAVG